MVRYKSAHRVTYIYNRSRFAAHYRRTICYDTFLVLLLRRRCVRYVIRLIHSRFLRLLPEAKRDINVNNWP